MSKIVIKNAVKKYGDTVVIEGLNAEIPEGSLFTLLGPRMRQDHAAPYDCRV